MAAFVLQIHIRKQIEKKNTTEEEEENGISRTATTLRKINTTKI